MQSLHRRTNVQQEWQNHLEPPGSLPGFSTRDYQLIVGHQLAHINTPAVDRARLNAQISEVFNSLKDNQGKRPLVLGAIPFDTREPSSLYIYEHHEKRAHEDSKKTEDVGSLEQLATLTINDRTRAVDKNNFKASVANALSAISDGEIKKVVLSQSQNIRFHRAPAVENLMYYLKKRNPRAYSFVLPVGEKNIFLGASPELLLSRQGSYVISNPLAGSLPHSADEGMGSSRLQQSDKDNHEHRFVVENIARNIVPHCVELSITETPKVLSTKTMLHLSSTVEGHLRKDAPNALNLALDLHPTPAVCGTPTLRAKKFILQNEGHDRGFYTGLVGWMNAEGDGDWAVSIRCGLLTGATLCAYAGAGIVAGSLPEAEWQETEEKIKTLISTLEGL